MTNAEPVGSEQPASRPRLTLAEDDIEIFDVDARRPWAMAASDLEVMSMEPRDYRDLLDDRPRPPPPLPSPPTDLTDANKDSDGHDGDAFKWP